jgi:hypothetical protein
MPNQPPDQDFKHKAGPKFYMHSNIDTIHWSVCISAAPPGQGGGNNGSSIRSAMARACYRVAGIDWAACTALTVPPKTVATRCGGAGGVRPGHEAGRYDAGRRLAGGIRGPAQGTRRDTLYRPCLRDGNSCSCVARRRPARRRHQARSQDDVRPAGATKRGRKTTSGPPAPPSAAD